MKLSNPVFLLLLSCSLPVLAQESLQTKPLPPSGPDQAQSVHTRDRSLTLDVVVTDKSGKPISGLQQQASVLLDNKRPQPIVSFHAVAGTQQAADPVEIILLVDEVNTGFDNVAYERQSIQKFLRQNNGALAHPVSMIFFSDTGTEVLNGSSRDGNALEAQFEQHETKLRTIRRSEGFYGAVDRFQLSISNLNSIAAREQATPGRKILVWISPGWPYLSGPQTILSAKEEQSLFNSIVALSNALRRARITVYSVDPLGTGDAAGFRTFYYEEFLKGVSSPKDAQPGNLALQVIATETGGRVLNSNNDTTRLISEAAAEADAYYVLTMDTPPAEHPDEYHALTVKLEQAGLTARTRTGYYAQP